MGTGELNIMWAQVMVEELVRLGVSCFCLCPGSRCTPLTTAVALHPGIQPVLHGDERGAAFYAIGHARATGQPGVVICTSGTAVANLMPAVVEAAMDRVPMLLLTADRPPELRDTQANQTIDQVHLFGRYLRWQADLPCPTAEIPPRMLLTTVDHAWHRSLHGLPGPVQINCMYRQPFLPEVLPATVAVSPWADEHPYVRHASTPSRCSDEPLGAAVAVLREAASPLVMIGSLPPDAQPAVAALVEQLGWPALADVASGLRLGKAPACCITHHELLSPAIIGTFDLVLQIGGRFVGKSIEVLLGQADDRPVIRLQDHSERDDPWHRPGQVLEGDLGDTCRRLVTLMPAGESSERLTALRRASDDCASRLSAVQGEPAAARMIASELRDGEGLFLGASLPIRDFNTFAQGGNASLRVAANRGASGIDGTLASAAGFAHGLQAPVTVVLGDLALLHDLNSLPLAGASGQRLRIIVFNNSGGAIFSLLPVASHQALQERFFRTPHNWTFKHAASMFGLPYFLAEQVDELPACLASGRDLAVSLIEVRTGKDDYGRALAIVRQ